MAQKNKTPQPATVPPRAKNGVKVYYDAVDEHHLRQQAAKNGMTLQQFLKWKTARERQGLPT